MTDGVRDDATSGRSGWRGLRRWAWAVPPLALLAATFPRSGGRLMAETPAATAAPVRLSPRDFVRVIRLTGLTEAVTSYTVTVPLLAGSSRGSLTIVKLAAPGSAVRQGDLLVEFDRQDQDKVAFEKRVEYSTLVEQIARTRAEHDTAKVKDESELAQAENAVKAAELEVLKNEMLSRIKAEQNQQSLDEARARLEALRRSFPLKRDAATAARRIFEIRRDRAAAAMEHAERNARAMRIVSPIDGLVVPKMTWKGNGPGDIREGDDVWPGLPVLQVVSRTSIRVRARVSQADIASVAAGQPAVVRLDAYPGLEMRGRITQMGPVAMPGSFSPRVRTFTALVEIDGSNPKLLPDLSAAVDVEVERVRDALVVRRSVLEERDGRTWVRVRGGASRAVTLGPRDALDAVVLDGLRPGDEVLP